MNETEHHTISVILAEDHPVTRKGLRATLDETPDIQVIGEAESGREVQRLITEHQPKVLLLDLQMPGTCPTALEAWVREHYPETITLVLTAHDRDVYLASMLKAGAFGYLTKDAPLLHIVAAIRRAVSGEFLFTPEQVHRVQRWQKECGERWEKLTPRERQVLDLLCRGLDNGAIAVELDVGVRTVESHITRVNHKLGVRSRLEAVAWMHEYMSDN